MDAVNIVLATNIQKYRKQSGLNQVEFAKKLGVTFQAVSKWENKKSTPDISLLPEIADIFGCSIDDLFSYVAKKNREDINLIPGDSIPDELKGYVSKQIKSQIDNNGSTDKLIGIIADNLDGNFALTDDNIERLLDAYRDLYKGLQKKKKTS